jgi:hypothetical protein
MFNTMTGDTPGALSGLAELICRGGETTLFCHRCAGVWAGAALALPAAFFLRRRIPVWLVVLLSVAFLQMPVMGWGKIPLPETIKALSGQVFAFSAVLGLALAPVRRRLRTRPTKNAAGPILIISVIGIAILQALIGTEVPAAAATLDALCLIGLAAAAGCTAAFVAAAVIPKRAHQDPRLRDK